MVKFDLKILLLVVVTFAVFFLNGAFKDPNTVEVVNGFDVEKNVSYHLENHDNDTTIELIDKAILRLLRTERLSGGAEVAVSYKGRVVYSKGLGYSDLTDSIEMQPYNLMRVASVSKLITAVAVMHLVEEGKISLNQRIFGPMGILNDDRYLYFRDPKMADVTVYQLLNHSGGWTARWGDPMFMPLSIAQQMGKSLPVSMTDIIRFMQTKRMHFRPGTGSVYSNFGYGILGEVVAKASKLPYEEYVRSEILAPLGIYDMQIGFSHIEHRLPNEVIYYEADTTNLWAFDYIKGEQITRRAYGAVDIQTLGSAGGWVASATDLLKIALTIDEFESIPDQLSPEIVDTMVHHAPGFDPLGWRTTVGDNWYRSGTLAATSAIIGRLDNEVCYVVLLNCANYRGPLLATMIRDAMNRAIARIEEWPDVDLLRDDYEWQCYKLRARGN